MYRMTLGEMRKPKKDIDRDYEGDELGDGADPMLDPTLYDAEFLAK